LLLTALPHAPEPFSSSNARSASGAGGSTRLNLDDPINQPAASIMTNAAVAHIRSRFSIRRRLLIRAGLDHIHVPPIPLSRDGQHILVSPYSARCFRSREQSLVEGVLGSTY
jgi:hypothetical protein